ncbi:MAG: hypothetical protein GY832_31760 [Chloroflexi bacterium]|nr:hypothetical protein [Chloroflexota bacterium]
MRIVAIKGDRYDAQADHVSVPDDTDMQVKYNEYVAWLCTGPKWKSFDMWLLGNGAERVDVEEFEVL